MPHIDFPVNPIRESLYNAKELYQGFDYHRPETLTETLDFRAYRHFVQHGGAFPDSYFTGMMRSLHDFSIWNCVQDTMNQNKLIGIMGGHKMERSSNGTYATIARISRKLTQKGYLMCSGGGPGAMEATHVGAYFSVYEEEIFSNVLKTLEKHPHTPALKFPLVKADGSYEIKNIELLADYLAPAFELLEKYPEGARSLSIPTWLYGHEPSTPFATHIAKYYQNSIREDGLLTVAKYGIIYTEGKAGTIQEIFQDATQNFYETVDFFSPMVFLNVKYWTQDYPVKTVLDKLMSPEQNKKYLLYSDDEDEIIAFLENFKPEPSIPLEE